MAATIGSYQGGSPNYGDYDYSINNQIYYISGKLPKGNCIGPNGNRVAINFNCTGAPRNIIPINNINKIYKCDTNYTFV